MQCRANVPSTAEGRDRIRAVLHERGEIECAKFVALFAIFFLSNFPLSTDCCFPRRTTLANQAACFRSWLRTPHVAPSGVWHAVMDSQPPRSIPAGQQPPPPALRVAPGAGAEPNDA